MAIMYQLVGLLCTLIVREVVYVPRDFRWGIIVVSFSNCQLYIGMWWG